MKKKFYETAQKLIEQNGDCTGIRCSNCPLFMGGECMITVPHKTVKYAKDYIAKYEAETTIKSDWSLKRFFESKRNPTTNQVVLTLEEQEEILRLLEVKK